MIVKLLTAFLGGLAALLSPCILPLIPIYIYLFSKLNLKTIIAFSIAFTLFFVLLGATSSFVGKFLLKYKAYINIIIGILIPVLLFFKHKIPQFQMKFKDNYSSIFEGFLLGFGIALIWLPCTGPVIASILTLALKTKLIQAILLMLAYTFGMLIPFFLLLWLLKVKPEFKQFLMKKQVTMFSDIFIVLISLYFIYSGLKDLGIIKF